MYKHKIYKYTVKKNKLILSKLLKVICTNIWCFIIIQNVSMKYMSKRGQYIGKSRILKNVKNIDNNVDFTTEDQNLNSGSRRINGLNSSFVCVGKDGPVSSKLK